MHRRCVGTQCYRVMFVKAYNTHKILVKSCDVFVA